MRRHLSTLFIAAILTALAVPAASAGEGPSHVCDTHTISSLCW
ncbi:hypothetical protein [Streptomyces alanosinicus]|uniref:Uncharacterized protein n=1 Tax=Streptomyces alanosinicus TaxID=68171 RepID=A0A918YHN6_9ACTN|nr:hypothetical protein [Streptomyces alanosinicus]GHE03471.1 hypothetical protein GCM10010339_30930 [Streptomyces alanosinicus]